MRRFRIQSAAVAGLVAAVLAGPILIGCGDEELVYARPPFSVVDGTPEVAEGGAAVDFEPPEVDPDVFRYSAAIRVDVFRQEVVRKVDILWMVDNSPSMEAVQDNLSMNFASFIHDLAHADPAVDYQIGVVTPDTMTEGGALRPIHGQPSVRYIACNSPEFPNACNIGSLLQAEDAFKQTVAVGADGLPVERGLLAVHMALSEPMVSTVNAGFLREDAALYVIIVSDEGDASCHPIYDEPPSGDYAECTFYPNCRCKDDEDLEFGSRDYFVRFLKGLKGFGNHDLVTVASIVGDDREDVRLCLRMGDSGCAQWADYRGCRNPNVFPPIHAVYAPRYTEVAERTGGVTISICEEDYSEALSELGFAVSGQQRDFQLSRAPVPPDIEPFRVSIITEEDGRRVRREVPFDDQTGDGGWSYVRCEDQITVNSVRFSDPWIPPPRALVEVAYHVDAGGLPDCE